MAEGSAGRRFQLASAFTHVVVGGAFAGLGPRPRLRLALVLAALSVLPDADVIAFRFGIPYEHPFGHRGFTHSIPFALLCGAVTPWLSGHSRRPDVRTWWRIASLGFLATLSHGVLDAFTNGGLGVGFFTPFRPERFFFPWRPLQVSPISAGAFFSSTGLRILASEIVWVWLPLAVAAGVTLLARRRPPDAA